VLQPIRVRPSGDGYEIVAGERRYRAAVLAGCADIPAIVVEQEDARAHLDSLVENIQREDLNPLDRAEALAQLRVNLGLQSWEAVGQYIGVSRQRVYNLLNLRQLPGDVQEHIRAGEITEKHGRALHLLQKEPELQARALAEMTERELSGNQAMGLARALRAGAPPTEAPKTGPAEYKTDMLREARAARKAVERLERRVGEEVGRGRLPALRTDLRATMERLRRRLARIERALEAVHEQNGGQSGRDPSVPPPYRSGPGRAGRPRVRAPDGTNEPSL
jgi:ParB/RepB/Spo0J family partition protein